MMKGTVYGMISMSNVFILRFSTCLQGDINKLNLALTFENPYVTVASDAFEGDLAPYGKELTEAMIKLMKAMKEMVVDKLPDLVSQAERFPDQIEWVKARAEVEFERLDMMAKAKAVSALASNIKTLGKVPGFVKGAAENYKAQFEELKELFEDMKNNKEKYGQGGKQCFDKKIHMPPPCYESVDGAISYTKQERGEWEYVMRGHHRGTYFDPTGVSKTHQSG